MTHNTPHTNNSVTPPPHKRQSTGPRSTGIRKALSALAIVALAGLGGGAGAWLVMDTANPTTSSPVATQDGNQLRLQSEQDISQVASKVKPSVVSISTSVQSTRGRVVGQGAGTGVIVSKDGYVMTNNHVVNGASSVVVTTSDGDVYENVKVIGFDPLNDIAFLKIAEPKDLKPAALGDSSTLKIGQSVVAIGNSLGEYSDTVTSGIVSGLNRPVAASSEDGSSTEMLAGLIQTDAAINPGNSGGPLVNLAGQVIGINTAVASGAQGIGFAIPINSTKGVLASVLETGKVERAYIGVRYVDITPAIAKQQDLSVRQGALVGGDQVAEAIVPGGPAAKAGLKTGDIIIKINSSRVGEDGGITSLIGAYKPGETIKVTYLRDGKEHTTNLTLAKYEEKAAPAAVAEPQQQTDSLREWLGF